MPIKINGTTFNNGGIVTFNGSRVDSIKFNDTEVWRRSVTLTNLVGNNEVVHTHVFDASPYSDTEDVKTFTTISGHKYFVRAAASVVGSFTSGGDSSALIDSTTIASTGNTTNKNITASGSSTKARHYYNGSVGAGTYGDAKATFYMFVDITPLEEATGQTYTAAQFWSFIGSQVFYGSKEFTP